MTVRNGAVQEGMQAFITYIAPEPLLQHEWRLFMVSGRTSPMGRGILEGFPPPLNIHGDVLKVKGNVALPIPGNAL